MSDTTCCGHTNYETFSAGVAMDNDREQTQNIRLLVSDTRDLAKDGAVENADIHLADELKRWQEDLLSELDGLAATLLAAAFGKIDWLQLAREYLGEGEGTG